MRYRLFLTRQAEKEFLTLEKNEQKRVQSAFETLRENPQAGKQLEGELKGIRSLRVWPYRILYTIDKKVIIVTVLTIGHRKDVYR